jgi:hypothetical protein
MQNAAPPPAVVGWRRKRGQGCPRICDSGSAGKVTTASHEAAPVLSSARHTEWHVYSPALLPGKTRCGTGRQGDRPGRSELWCSCRVVLARRATRGLPERAGVAPCARYGRERCPSALHVGLRHARQRRRVRVPSSRKQRTEPGPARRARISPRIGCRAHRRRATPSGESARARVRPDVRGGRGRGRGRDASSVTEWPSWRAAEVVASGVLRQLVGSDELYLVRLVPRHRVVPYRPLKRRWLSTATAAAGASR